MNIDERLQALTRSVELPPAMHKETDKEVKRLGKYLRSVMQIVLDHETILRRVEGIDETEDE